MRSAFLSVTSVISKCKFPHWKGVEIETATLPAYGSDTPFDWSEIKVIPTGDRPHDFSYTLKQEAWIELIDAVAAYIKLNPSGEWLSSDSRTYYKENGFRYTDSQKKKFLKTVSGGLTDYMSDWWEWTKDGRPENVLFLKR